MCFDHCQGHDESTTVHVDACLHGSWSLNANTWTCQLCGEQRRPAPDGSGYLVFPATIRRFEDAPVPAVDLDPCKECHPELHRAQCWPNARCVATEEESA